jgi:hypothetical protein
MGQNPFLRFSLLSSSGLQHLTLHCWSPFHAYSNEVKLSLCLTKYYAMKTCEGVAMILVFLTSVQAGGERLASCPCSFTPPPHRWKSLRYLLLWRFGGSQTRSGRRGGEILDPTRTRTPIYRLRYRGSLSCLQLFTFFFIRRRKRKQWKIEIFCKNGQVYWYINEKLGCRKKINCTSRTCLDNVGTHLYGLKRKLWNWNVLSCIKSL